MKITPTLLLSAAIASQATAQTATPPPVATSKGCVQQLAKIKDGFVTEEEAKALSEPRP